MIALLAPAEILQSHGTPEEIAAQNKHYSPQNSKNYFITKCLIDTQTAGFAMRRWADFLKSIVAEKHVGFKSQQLSAILTEQSAWQRKLAEILTLQICFSETNDNKYYYHYLLAEDLARCLHQMKEQQEYFHSESAILDAESRNLLDKIREIEHASGFNIAKCWYLTEKNLISGRKGKIKPGSLTCSVGGLVKPALEKARKFEKRALGYSYYYAISSPSENIHFHPLPSSQNCDEPRVQFGLSQSGLLAISIAARAQELLNSAWHKSPCRRLSSTPRSRAAKPARPATEAPRAC